MRHPRDHSRPVVGSRVVAAPAERVWAAVAAPGHLADCHPFCERNPVESWPGVGSCDAVHYRSGWVYERRFVGWVDGVGYDLEIGAAGGPTSAVRWRIEPLGDDSCTLTITVDPHVIERGPVVLRPLLQATYVRRRLARYLDAVLCGVEQWVTTGERVGADAFGRHPWFSSSA